MLELRGGIDVQDFVKTVVEAVEDHKITRDEFELIQKRFGKLSASEQDHVTRELASSRTFQAKNLSLSSLQNVLARGTFDEFNAGITLPGAY